MFRFGVLLALLFIILSTTVTAHPGRTDQYGGHYDRSTGDYHMHNGESAGQDQSDKEYEHDPLPPTKDENITFVPVEEETSNPPRFIKIEYVGAVLIVFFIFIKFVFLIAKKLTVFIFATLKIKNVQKTKIVNWYLFLLFSLMLLSFLFEFFSNNLGVVRNYVFTVLLFAGVGFVVLMAIFLIHEYITTKNIGKPIQEKKYISEVKQMNEMIHFTKNLPPISVKQYSEIRTCAWLSLIPLTAFFLYNSTANFVLQYYEYIEYYFLLLAVIVFAAVVNIYILLKSFKRKERRAKILTALLIINTLFVSFTSFDNDALTYIISFVESFSVALCSQGFWHFVLGLNDVGKIKRNSAPETRVAPIYKFAKRLLIVFFVVFLLTVVFFIQTTINNADLFVVAGNSVS